LNNATPTILQEGPESDEAQKEGAFLQNTNSPNGEDGPQW